MATDFVQAIGRTNDAILYGGQVTLWVRADDELLGHDRPEGAVELVEGPRRAVRRDLRALQRRLLQDRPAAVLAGRGRVPQPEDRQVPPLRQGRAEARSASRLGWNRDAHRDPLRRHGLARAGPARGPRATRARRPNRSISARSRPAWKRRPRRSRGFDAVLVRTMPAGSLEQVVFRMDVLHAAAARGVPVLNPPRAVETCVDKYLTNVRLAARRAAHAADRGVASRPTTALRRSRELGGDVVVKPLFGSEGRGMCRVTDRRTGVAHVSRAGADRAGDLPAAVRAAPRAGTCGCS